MSEKRAKRKGVDKGCEWERAREKKKERRKEKKIMKGGNEKEEGITSRMRRREGLGRTES